MLNEQNIERKLRNKVPREMEYFNYRGKLEDGTCFAIEGDKNWVAPKKTLQPFDVQFKT